MRGFHHHPDGFVAVTSDADQYVDTLANFAIDASAASLPTYPGLPSGQSGEVYVADRIPHPSGKGDMVTRHSGHTGINQHAPSHKPEALDKYIAGCSALVSAQRVRRAAEAEAVRKKQQEEFDASLAEARRKAEEIAAANKT